MHKTPCYHDICLWFYEKNTHFNILSIQYYRVVVILKNAINALRSSQKKKKKNRKIIVIQTVEKT